VDKDWSTDLRSDVFMCESIDCQRVKNGARDKAITATPNHH